MEKLLTISIAAYNVEKYLKKTLDSCVIRKELLGYLDVCIVDDGSEDNTALIAMEYVQHYPETFRYLKKENGGYGSTVNYSINAAKGKYFRLLDGDDWYCKTALEKYVSCLQRCDSDLILSDYSIVYEKSNRIVNKKNFEYVHMQKYSIDSFDSKCKIAMYSFCYKTNLLRGKKITLTEHCFYTDMEFMLLPLRFITSFTYLNIDLYQYRIGLKEQSVSIAGMKKHYQDYYKVFLSLQNSELEYINFDEYNKNIDSAIKKSIILMAKTSYCSLLCLPLSHESYEKIKKLDANIKKYNLDFGNSFFRVPSYKYNFITYIFSSICVKVLVILKSF